MSILSMINEEVVVHSAYIMRDDKKTTSIIGAYVDSHEHDQASWIFELAVLIAAPVVEHVSVLESERRGARYDDPPLSFARRNMDIPVYRSYISYRKNMDDPRD